MKHLFDNVVVDNVVGLLLPLIIMLSSDCFLFHISITASTHLDLLQRAFVLIQCILKSRLAHSV